MKKSICVLMLFIIVLTVCACKKKDEDLSLDLSTNLATKNNSTADAESLAETSSKDSCDHKFENADCVKPKTCKICGFVDGEALGHKWNNPDCKTFKTCTVCEKTEPEKGEHIYKDGLCTVCQKKDPDYGTLKASVWQIFKSPILLSIDFVNCCYSEIKMVELTESPDEHLAQLSGDESTVRYIENGKEWIGVSGCSPSISFNEEDEKVSVMITDSQYPEDFGKGFQIERVGDTTFKVIENTLGENWKLSKDDVFTATERN